MISLLNNLLKKLHFALIVSAIWGVYDRYESHLENIQNLANKKQTAEAELQKFQKKVDVINKFKNDVSNAKDRIKEMAEQITSVQRQLPTDLNDTEILDIFSSKAEGINIKDVYLAPKGETKREFYFSRSYEFKAIGTFLQFLIYLEQLAKEERLINISRVILESGEDTKQKGRFHLVSAEVNMDAFRYNTEHRVDTSLDSLNKEEENIDTGMDAGSLGTKKKINAAQKVMGL